MNNKIMAVVIVVVLVLGGFFLFKNRGVAPVVEEDQFQDAVEVVGSLKEFTVDAASYSFSPSSMTVNKGDTVKITVKNAGGVHDFKLDEFLISTRMLNTTGEEQTITFVADKVGTFEYYCSIGTHRAMGMVGTLIVR